MTSGFAGLIGRWFRRHTAESTPAQKGVVVTSPHPDMPGPCRYFSASGIAADVPPSSLQPETFEAMVGFDNLCLIARAADNVEAMLHEMVLGAKPTLEIRGDDESGRLFCGALQELGQALAPYRIAHEQHYRREP